MKHKLIETGQDILVILMNHLMFIGFGMTVAGLFKQDENYIWLWCVLAAVPLLLYFARVKFENFFLFFALHLVLPFVLAFLPLKIVPKILVLTITIVYVVWSISIRLKGRRKGEDVFIPLFSISVLGVMTLIENMHSKMGWETAYLWLAILYIAGYFVYSFMNQYQRFLIVNESSAANIPEQEIFTSGMKQTLFFMVGSVLLLILTANIGWVSYIMSWLGNGLLAVLRILFSRLSGDELEDVKPRGLELVVDDMEMYPQEGEPALFWVILEQVVLVATMVFLVGGIIFSIVMGIRYLWKYFHMTTVKKTKKLQAGIDIRETCTIEKNKREANRWFSFLNHREKIRKIYRKQVIKHKKDIIGDYNIDNLNYMTAKECCDKIVTGSKVSAKNLKIIYEKARYSAEGITAEDVKYVRGL